MITGVLATVPLAPEAACTPIDKSAPVALVSLTLSAPPLKAGAEIEVEEALAAVSRAVNVPVAA